MVLIEKCALSSPTMCTFMTADPTQIVFIHINRELGFRHSGNSYYAIFKLPKNHT